MSVVTWFKRYASWERGLHQRVAARAQDRELAGGLDEGCLICDAGPWAWAYPMGRVQRATDGGEILFPAWVPVCGGCHHDLKHGRSDSIEARLQGANPGRRGRGMRGILPAFLEAQDGPPVARADAPQLVRPSGERKRR